MKKSWFKQVINHRDPKEVKPVAKDGTNRGGRRVRAGGKPDPLADKITKGKAAKVLEPADLHPETMLAADGLGSV